MGRLMHTRLTPLKHAFSYPVYFFCLDLDELSELDQLSRLFGYNKKRLLAIHDKDYLTAGAQPIRAKLMPFLEKEGCAQDITHIRLVTVPRYFNYVFNPVSFYYCYDAGGSLRCNVAEVNNTFGERHLYVLHRQMKPKHGFESHYQIPKAFFVSPFNDMQGDYDFHFSSLGETLDIRVNIIHEGRSLFLTSFHGKALDFSSKNVVTMLMRYPLSASLSMPRIVWQALKLRCKGLKPYLKPNPSSMMTIRTASKSQNRKDRRDALTKKR